MTDSTALVERLWTRRHELTDAEWLEAAPVLLGMQVAALDASGEDGLARRIASAQTAFEDLEKSAWRSVVPPASGVIVSPSKWTTFRERFAAIARTQGQS